MVNSYYYNGLLSGNPGFTRQLLTTQVVGQSVYHWQFMKCQKWNANDIFRCTFESFEPCHIIDKDLRTAFGCPELWSSFFWFWFDPCRGEPWQRQKKQAYQQMSMRTGPAFTWRIVPLIGFKKVTGIGKPVCKMGYPTWLWLTLRHGFSMALIEIDGLPFLNIRWIFPWRTVSSSGMIFSTRKVTE